MFPLSHRPHQPRNTNIGVPLPRHHPQHDPAMGGFQYPPNGGPSNGGPPNGAHPNDGPPNGTPPNGGPPPVPPYTGAPSSNDQNYRGDAYSQQQPINGGQQPYMYPAGPSNGSGMHGMPPQQGQYQQQRQPLPPLHQPQQAQYQGGQSLKQEQDQSPTAMNGRTPTDSAPTTLVPLDKTDDGDSPASDLINGAALKEPASHSMIELGRRYTLQVVQQPQRARMCGFGDKDRRPITPPPCIRLVIIDVATGVEVDTNDIEYGLFVLNVDLWSEDGKREVNLVRHSTSSPAISSTIPSSYQQAQVGGTAAVYGNPLPNVTGATEIVRSPQYPYHAYDTSGVRHPTAQQFNTYAQPQPPPPNPNPYSNQNQYPQHQPQYQAPQQQRPQYGQQPQEGYGQYQQQPRQPHQQQHQQQPQQQLRRPSSRDFGQRQDEPQNHHVYYHTGNSVHAVAANAGRPDDHPISTQVGPVILNQWGEPMYAGSRVPAAPTPQGMYTRNLIGSLSASAFRLADPNDKIGIWFVLQDLSVRTEGNFRLRFSFCNVGMPSKTPNGNPANQISITNTGKAPILASCFSEVFTVYSAKKFPGVVESTALSKCFATQGIKIPIRKDGAPKKGRGGMDDDDD